MAKEGAAAQQEWRRLAHIAAQGPEAWEAERQAWIEVFFPFSRIDFLPYRAHLRLYSCTSISNLSGTKLPPLSPKAVPTVLDACAPGLRQGRRPTPEDAARSLPAARTRDGREAARERPPPPLSVEEQRARTATATAEVAPAGGRAGGSGGLSRARPRARYPPVPRPGPSAQPPPPNPPSLLHHQRLEGPGAPSGRRRSELSSPPSRPPDPSPPPFPPVPPWSEGAVPSQLSCDRRTARARCAGAST